jgi:subtilisin family serine protease
MSVKRGVIVCLKQHSKEEENAISNGLACATTSACGAVPKNVCASETFNGFSVRGDLSEECTRRLLETGEIDHIEDDIQVQMYASNTPWGIKRVGADKSTVANMTPSTSNGVDVDVFVLDTGVQKSHPYLNVVSTLSLLDDETYSDDMNGHGTMCAGIIGAWKQEDGMVGVAPGARIHGIKVLDKDGSGYLSDIISGVEEVVKFKRNNPGRKVVANLSLGGYAGSTRYTALDTEIVEAIDRHMITFVVAAGNSSDDASLYTPAHVKEAITVGSYDMQDNYSTFSNTGLAVDILAPGNDIRSTTTLGKIQNETSHLRLGFRSEIPNFHPLTFATFHLSILSVWRH